VIPLSMDTGIVLPRTFCISLLETFGGVTTSYVI